MGKVVIVCMLAGWEAPPATIETAKSDFVTVMGGVIPALLIAGTYLTMGLVTKDDDATRVLATTAATPLGMLLSFEITGLILTAFDAFEVSEDDSPAGVAILAGLALAAVAGGVGAGLGAWYGSEHPGDRTAVHATVAAGAFLSLTPLLAFLGAEVVDD